MMPGMTDVQTAEELWARAHEHVRRGDFASAVRDLAACFQMLQALGDPRVYEVHKRWTEVHQMYLEEGARPEQPPAAQAATLEAQAEAAANTGDLDTAISLYTKAAAQNPANELVKERLDELTQARRRADDLVRGTAPAAPTPAPSIGVPSASASSVSVPSVSVPSASAPSASPLSASALSASASSASASSVSVPPTTTRPGGLAEDDWGDVRVDDEGPAAPAVAPTMAIDDAPVGMQSLDVPFSIGDAIDSAQADELPVEANPTGEPAPAVAVTVTITSALASVTDDVETEQAAVSDIAFLEELLARVQANRRRAS